MSSLGVGRGRRSVNISDTGSHIKDIQETHLSNNREKLMCSPSIQAVQSINMVNVSVNCVVAPHWLRHDQDL